MRDGKTETCDSNDEFSPTSVLYNESGRNPCETLNDSDGKNQNPRYHDRCTFSSLEEKRKEIEGGNIDLEEATRLISS